MPSRFQLRGPSLEAIKDTMLAEYGSSAVIVSAEKVTVGGVAGLLATRYVEAVIEIPTTAPAPAPAGSNHRRALAALLDDANASETTTLPLPGMSTSNTGFSELLDTLDHDTASRTASVRGVPLPSADAGDLIVFAGLGRDGLEEADSLASSMGITALTAGLAEGGIRLDEPRAGLSARTADRIAGRASLAGFGLGVDQRQVLGQLGYLQALRADQVWLVVDATRKTEDTSAWVRAVASAMKVHGLAVIGSTRTSTAQTVNQLGIPVGRIDGAPARRPAL